MSPTYTVVVFGRESGPYTSFKEALSSLLEGIMREHEAEPSLRVGPDTYSLCYMERSDGGHDVHQLSAVNLIDLGQRIGLVDEGGSVLSNAPEPNQDVLRKAFRYNQHARMYIGTLAAVDAAA